MKRTKAIVKDEKDLRRYITPAVDLFEAPDSYILFIDMPGVSKENLSVKIVDDSLVVQGKFDIPIGKDERVLLNEIADGEYRREFVLSGDVDRNKIDAKLVNGVLILTLGKSEKSKEVEIKIE